MSEERALIQSYEDHHHVTYIPRGQSLYGPEGVPSSRKSRLLFERHERVRQMYRDLITHGFDKWEIAALMQVRDANIRRMANNIGLINKLKGYGQCRTA